VADAAGDYSRDPSDGAIAHGYPLYRRRRQPSGQAGDERFLYRSAQVCASRARPV
jgi:hypothetical protein